MSFETPLCKRKLQNALRSLGDQKAHSFESHSQLTAETSTPLDILWLLKFWIFKDRTKIDRKWGKVLLECICSHMGSKETSVQICL